MVNETSVFESLTFNSIGTDWPEPSKDLNQTPQRPIRVYKVCYLSMNILDISTVSKGGFVSIIKTDMVRSLSVPIMVNTVLRT